MAQLKGNISGNAYALTVLCPIKSGFTPDEIAYVDVVRDRLQAWNTRINSPMAQVPQTYLCRYYVLDDVYTQSLPGGSAPDTWTDYLPVVPDGLRPRALPQEDHLQSRYLVFSSNFYAGPEGTPDAYLRGMWEAITDDIVQVWGYCYGFEGVNTPQAFADYMKKCEREASLFFVGSNDDPLPEQLKALYLKQEFTKFAIDNQGLDAPTLRRNFEAFYARVAPHDVMGPTWEAGKYRL